DLAKPRPVSFTNEVMGVLGRAGCNAGACHGHNSGKGGFKLSLRGYDPAADHRALTLPENGRVDLDDPAQSKVLLKPTGKLAHRAGKRFEEGSEHDVILREWLAEKARSDAGEAVRLERLEVLPEARVLPGTDLRQQLAVRARFADGSVRDVTHLAVYELSAD